MRLKIYVMLLLSMVSLSVGAAIEVSDARLRSPLPGQTTAVVYLQLTNQREESVELMGASLVGAQSVEIHQHSHRDGMMRMRRVASVGVEPGATLAFSPGGYHFMVFDFSMGTEPLVLTLQFSDNHQLQVPLRLESL